MPRQVVLDSIDGEVMLDVFHILILDDDLEALAHLLKALDRVERKLAGRQIELSVTIMSRSDDVARLINPLPADEFDIILLDRDCKLSGSFHVLDIEHFGPERIISISSAVENNFAAMERGITQVIRKWGDWDEWAQAIGREVIKRVSIIP